MSVAAPSAVHLTDEQLAPCLLEDGQTVMTTLTNSGYLLYTLNLLKSLQPFGLDRRVLLVCVDARAAEVLARKGYTAILSLHENALGSFCAWNTKGYDRVCYWKLEVIHRILSLGKHVLLVDGDIVFRKDPMPDLRTWWADPTHDVWCQNDSMEDHHTQNMCTGYLFIKTSLRLAELYNCVSSAGQAKYKLCAFDNNDQTYFNRYVKPSVKMCALPLAEYPNGKVFYDQRPPHPTLVHFNWVHGHVKMAKMKEHQMWLLTEDEEDEVYS